MFAPGRVQFLASLEGCVKVPVVNEFWVAGDFMVTLATGASQDVLRLATRAEDASAFGQQTATNIMQFVASRINS
jgi:hypothetical protein